MATRIICLHGMGVNSRIFEKQFSNVKKLLPTEYEFIFLTGLMSCDPAPGVAAVHPGPYECWYDTPTTVKVENAHRGVLDYAATYGPFDGIIGFSQGAAVAASILLHHELAGLPPPFKFAMFLCSPLPFSYSLENGIDARSAFGEEARRPARPDCPDKVPEELIPDAYFVQGETALRRPKRSDSVVSEPLDESESFYQMFHSSVDDIRIQIPTGHVVGEKDEWKIHSLQMKDLCDSGKSTLLRHSGGHEIPADFAEEICDMIETLAIASQ